MSADESFLAEVPFFKLLDLDETRALAAVMHEVHFSPEQMLFHFGDRGDCLYIVKRGKVELFVKDHSGEKIVLRVANPGDLFGELAMLDNGPRTASAVAVEDTDLLILHQQDLLKFLHKKPDAALDLLAVLGGRLRKTNDLLRGRVTRNANEEIKQDLSWGQRLANFIAEFSGSMPFLFINAAMFAVWILLNVNIIPGFVPFDPYPFGFLTMAVSLEAIFLSIFVLLAQNLIAAKDRIRADIEYEINLKAELEIAYLHEKFDHMNAEMLGQLEQIKKLVKDKS